MTPYNSLHFISPYISRSFPLRLYGAWYQALLNMLLCLRKFKDYTILQSEWLGWIPSQKSRARRDNMRRNDRPTKMQILEYQRDIIFVDG